ncbi:hypothetical protein LGH83_06340 [Lichenihabitans sp. PAMC28606]|uniref:hypothetical protein n=1 Tax=Lichenihabitans sp. PAMC28606 TaxID=2880932 RepID=UPI001D09AD16|nr:hypothetical protein [Lichenihabitans sp. PAMC28606]UDL95818.1 hypothetical protein LGH83_06340 [Lichenihabitans sp. PAMC28606]
MYRLGAGNTLRDLVAAKGDDADLARSVRGNLTVRRKLATLAPSPEALERFNGTLDDQSHVFDEALRPDVRSWARARDHLKAQQASATGEQAKAIGDTLATLESHLHEIPP